MSNLIKKPINCYLNLQVQIILYSFFMKTGNRHEMDSYRKIISSSSIASVTLSLKEVQSPQNISQEGWYVKYD